MPQTICHLFEAPGHLPQVANWIYEAFWFGQDGYTPDFFEERLGQARNPDSIPLSLLALDHDTPAGTVNLIENDDPERPHLTPWLAALYVEPEFRGRGHAVNLTRRLLEEAARLDCDTVYLTTHIPDFYRRFGAEVHEEVEDDFWVMRIPLAAGIWAIRGDGDFGDIHLAQDRVCRVLVDRQDTAIHPLELGDGECVLLQALIARRPLGEALAAALAGEPGLEVPPLLARHLQRANFCDVILPATTDAQPRTASN